VVKIDRFPISNQHFLSHNMCTVSILVLMLDNTVLLKSPELFQMHSKLCAACFNISDLGSEGGKVKVGSEDGK
jgi:hypothetical protein